MDKYVSFPIAVSKLLADLYNKVYLLYSCFLFLSQLRGLEKVFSHYLNCLLVHVVSRQCVSSSGAETYKSTPEAPSPSQPLLLLHAGVKVDLLIDTPLHICLEAWSEKNFLAWNLNTRGWSL